MSSKQRVLFLCTGNSARSQMAEGLLRHMAGDRFNVFSAGTHPKGLNPLSVEAMKEIGLDISGQESKDVAVYASERFDFVITVCDRAKDHCPIFPGVPPLHWGFDDPTDIQTFRRVRDEIRQRLSLFLLAEKK